jgi:hypothetical protein
MAARSVDGMGARQAVGKYTLTDLATNMLPFMISKRACASLSETHLPNSLFNQHRAESAVSSQRNVFNIGVDGAPSSEIQALFCLASQGESGHYL